MNIIIIQCSPNDDGLTAACAAAAAEGARQAGVGVDAVLLNELPVGMRQVCERGSGECRTACCWRHWHRPSRW